MIKLENKTYTPDLADPDSAAYKALEAEFCAQVGIHTEVVLEMLAERERREGGELQIERGTERERERALELEVELERFILQGL